MGGGSGPPVLSASPVRRQASLREIPAIPASPFEGAGASGSRSSEESLRDTPTVVGELWRARTVGILDDVEIKQLVGRGAFGRVYKGADLAPRILHFMLVLDKFISLLAEQSGNSHVSICISGSLRLVCG